MSGTPHPDEPTSGADITAEVKEARRLAFGGYAADYDRIRPGWPEDAVTWLLGEPSAPLDVLDLGCGTGKGTVALVRLGHRAIGVDPSAEMLAVLRSHAALAGVPTHVAGAEDLPLPDGCVDAIACFQAWHWVDPGRGAAECARVLREGGILGMAWHRPDRSHEWIVELDERAERTDMGSGGEPFTVPGFEPFEEREFAYRQPMSVEDLVAAVASWSHVAISPRRERILDAVRDLGREVAARHTDGVVVFPFVTDTVRARRA